MNSFKYQLLPMLLLFALLTACNHSQPTTIPAGDTTVTANDTANTAQSKPERDSLLVPGTSAGAIAIGQDVEDVFKILGKPDSSDAAMQKTVAFWYKDHDRTSSSFAIYTARDTGENPIAMIRQIRVTSPAYKTEDKLGVSAPLSLLKTKFALRKVSLNNVSGHNHELYDTDKGIAFEVSPEGNCTAVIIHLANEHLKETYLPLR